MWDVVVGLSQETPLSFKEPLPWEVVLITDTGREVPHWRSRTREEARRVRRGLDVQACRRVRALVRRVR